MLQETTSRGLCGLVCPSRLSAGVCVYYCSTYYKAVREGGGMEDMCYERLRAKAGVTAV